MAYSGKLVKQQEAAGTPSGIEKFCYSGAEKRSRRLFFMMQLPVSGKCNSFAPSSEGC